MAGSIRGVRKALISRHVFRSANKLRNAPKLKLRWIEEKMPYAFLNYSAEGLVRFICLKIISVSLMSVFGDEKNDYMSFKATDVLAEY